MALIKVIVYFGLLVQLFDRGACSVSCQFDADVCGWKAVGTSKFSWRPHSGQTPDPDDRTSGPLNDVTCKNSNGRYMYLPGIYSKKDETAVFESELVNLSKQTWLTFWYFMNGVGVGSVKISQLFQNGTQQEIWSKQGEQSKDWQKGRVLVGPGQLRLRFQGSVRLPTGSDVAIDDVILDSEHTEFNTSHCLRQTTVPTTKSTLTPTLTTLLPTSHTQSSSPRPVTSRPTLPPADLSECGIIGQASNGTYLPGSCDFETGLCGLSVNANKEDTLVTWVISDKRDPPYHTTPITSDHTYANLSIDGHYLNFENHFAMFFGRKPPNKNASVETPYLNTTAVCVSFWHIMPTTEANLLVYIKDEHGVMTDVWRSDTLTEHWSKIVLHIRQNSTFKIGFQSRNKKHNAKLALDDIVIVPSTPRVSTANNGTTPTTVSPKMTSTSGPVVATHSMTNTSDNGTNIASSTVTVSTVPTTPSTTLLMQTSTSTPEPTHKTKKHTDSTTKKPHDVSGKGKGERQTSHHQFRNSSTVVGFSVGGLVLVTAIAVTVYFIRQSLRNKRFAKRQRNILNTLEDGKTNKGFLGLVDTNGKSLVNNGHAQNGVKRNKHGVSGELSTGNGMNSGLSTGNGDPRGLSTVHGTNEVGNDSFLHTNSLNDSNVITRF